jgi:ubiquinone/menaquinone biosynthesis C-methylase UbiE
MSAKKTAPRYKIAHRASMPPITDYEGSDYRHDYWEGRGREYEDLAERIALMRLLPARGRRLADLGAGYGRLSPLYDAYEQVILVDYSRSLLEEAQQRLGNERFVYVAADLYRLPLATNAVDTAVTVRVVHHLADVPLAFRQVARVTRPRGWVILEFANKRHLKNLLRWLTQRRPDPFDRRPREVGKMYYHFNPGWIAKLLREAQLSSQRQLSVSLFRSETLKRWVPARVLGSADGMLQRITAPLTLGPSVFVAAEVVKLGVPDLSDDLFCCLACGQEPLAREGDCVRCPACGASWPIENGIYVFK